jgi:hypothetical protein
MASFYFDRFSHEPYNEQWTRYLQTGAHVRDLQLTVEAQTAGIQDTLRTVSKEHRQVMEKSAAVVCQTLEKGFQQVVEQLDQANWRLNEINEGVGKLHAMLDWKTDIIIEQLYINNNYLRQISELLRIPDSQKQKALHIENGLKYLQNALQSLDNKRLFDEALDEFQLSLNIDRKDFFSLHRLGLIHFYSTNHLDLNKAFTYFTDAAFHAIVESNIDNSQRNYSLSRYPKGKESREFYLEEASNSLIYASRCCYLLNNLQVGIQKAEEAWKLTPKFPEAGFQLAKMYGAANQAAVAANVLEEVISVNQFYAVKAVEDIDLISHSNVQAKLELMRDKAVNEAKALLIDCKNKMIKGSQAEPFLNDIQSLIKSNSYLDAIKSIEFIFQMREWELTEFSMQINKGYKKADYAILTSEKRIIKKNYLNFVLFENSLINEKIKLEEKIQEFNNTADIKWRDLKIDKGISKVYTFVIIVAGLGLMGIISFNILADKLTLGNLMLNMILNLGVFFSGVFLITKVNKYWL